MCRDASRRQFHVVMAWSVDRLGRSLQDLVGFRSELHALGVDLFLHQQGQNYGGRDPQLGYILLVGAVRPTWILHPQVGSLEPMRALRLLVGEPVVLVVVRQ
jgi:hypothetical protein